MNEVKTYEAIEDSTLRYLLQFGKDDEWDELCQDSLVEYLAPLGKPYPHYDDHQVQSYWAGYFDALVAKLTRTDSRFNKWRKSITQY